MSRPLNEKAVAKVAKGIRLRRFYSTTVSDEELVREVIQSYREHTKRPPRPKEARK